MKKSVCLLVLFTVFSCDDRNKTTESQELISELKAFEEKNTIEDNTKQFIEEYLDAGNSPDWKTRSVPYFSTDPEVFLQEHSAFRKSFPDYKTTIKHLAVDGNEGIVWINIKATYAKTYAFENSTYGDGILQDIEAKNQKLSWDETWYFDVVDGKFGEKFDFLKDNHAVMKMLGEKE